MFRFRDRRMSDKAYITADFEMLTIHLFKLLLLVLNILIFIYHYLPLSLYIISTKLFMFYFKNSYAF